MVIAKVFALLLICSPALAQGGVSGTTAGSAPGTAPVEVGAGTTSATTTGSSGGKSDKKADGRKKGQERVHSSLEPEQLEGFQCSRIADATALEICETRARQFRNPMDFMNNSRR